MALCYVSAQFTFKTETMAKVLAAIRELAPRVRLEPGCLRYDVHRAMNNPDMVLFYEVWESPAALDVHSQAASLIGFLKFAEPYLAEPGSIEVWQALDVAP